MKEIFDNFCYKKLLNGQLLSVVVPVYNEDEVLLEFHQRISHVLCELQHHWGLNAEIVYVDDGSRDNTAGLMHSLASSDSRVVGVVLSRNFGKELAMTAGLDKAKGDMVVMIDADLQDPPELIPQMLVKYRQGYDVVYMKRRVRDGEGWLKKFTAKMFYKVLSKLSEVPIPENVGDFRLMGRKVVDALGKCRERRRFMKGLFAWVGFRQVELLYDRHPRACGKTKFNYWKLWNFALEGIVGYSSLPLKIASYLGLVAAGLGLLGGMYLTIDLMIEGVYHYTQMILIAICFIAGLQLLATGIIGEYLARIFIEVKRRPMYLVEDVYAMQDAAFSGAVHQGSTLS